MSISRRQAIRNALFVTAACSPWGKLAGATNIVGYESDVISIDPKQALFQPMEASTLSALEQMFPGYLQSSVITPLLPFTAILKNCGNSPAKAYGLRWVQHVGSSDHTLFSTMFKSQSSASGGSGIGTGWNTILYPGEYAVVTPLFLWSASKFRRHSGVIPIEKIGLKLPRAKSFLTSSSPNSSYRVRRDFKIGRHVAIGSPSYRIARYEAAINTESELASLLIATAGVPEGLALAVNQYLSTLDTHHGGLTMQTKYLYLKSVKMRIRKRGVHWAWATVKTLAQRQPLKLDYRERKRVS